MKSNPIRYITVSWDSHYGFTVTIQREKTQGIYLNVSPSVTVKISNAARSLGFTAIDASHGLSRFFSANVFVKLPE